MIGQDAVISCAYRGDNGHRVVWLYCQKVFQQQRLDRHVPSRPQAAWWGRSRHHHWFTYVSQLPFCHTYKLHGYYIVRPREEASYPTCFESSSATKNPLISSLMSLSSLLLKAFTYATIRCTALSEKSVCRTATTSTARYDLRAYLFVFAQSTTASRTMALMNTCCNDGHGAKFNDGCHCSGGLAAHARRCSDGRAQPMWTEKKMHKIEDSAIESNWYILIHSRTCQMLEWLEMSPSCSLDWCAHQALRGIASAGDLSFIVDVKLLHLRWLVFNINGHSAKLCRTALLWRNGSEIRQLEPPSSKIRASGWVRVSYFLLVFQLQ